MFAETLHRSFWLMPTYNGRRGVRHLSNDARAPSAENGNRFDLARRCGSNAVPNDFARQQL